MSQIDFHDSEFFARDLGNVSIIPQAVFSRGLMFPHSGNTRFNRRHFLPGSPFDFTRLFADREWSLCLSDESGRYGIRQESVCALPFRGPRLFLE